MSAGAEGLGRKLYPVSLSGSMCWSSRMISSSCGLGLAGWAVDVVFLQQLRTGRLHVSMTKRCRPRTRARRCVGGTGSRHQQLDTLLRCCCEDSVLLA